MTDRRMFAAALGFAFVAAWIAFNLSDAILCLIGAGLFYTAAGVFEGNVDLGALQGRFTQRGDTKAASPSPRPRVH